MPLIERAAARISTRADERPQSWLRAGADQRDERTLPWL
jgi:hypothetical protein